MVELVCSIWANKFFVILLLSKTPPPSARSPRRRPLRHEHRSRCHQTVLPLQLRLPERNHQKTDDYQSVRRDQRVSRILNYQIFTWSCFYKSSVFKKKTGRLSSLHPLSVSCRPVFITLLLFCSHSKYCFPRIISSVIHIINRCEKQLLV